MRLDELATVLRSKNAGPFMTTFDIFFDSDDAYLRVKSSGIIDEELVAKLYNISVTEVVGVFFVDGARGIKITILKPSGIASGDTSCTDIYGAQQYIPLLNIQIP